MRDKVESCQTLQVSDSLAVRNSLLSWFWTRKCLQESLGKEKLTNIKGETSVGEAQLFPLVLAPLSPFPCPNHICDTYNSNHHLVTMRWQRWGQSLHGKDGKTETWNDLGFRWHWTALYFFKQKNPCMFSFAVRLAVLMAQPIPMDDKGNPCHLNPNSYLLYAHCSVSLLFSNPFIQQILNVIWQELFQMLVIQWWTRSSTWTTGNDIPTPGNSDSAARHSSKQSYSSFKMHVFVKSTDSQHKEELN